MPECWVVGGKDELALDNPVGGGDEARRSGSDIETDGDTFAMATLPLYCLLHCRRWWAKDKEEGEWRTFSHGT